MKVAALTFIVLLAWPTRTVAGGGPVPEVWPPEPLPSMETLVEFTPAVRQPETPVEDAVMDALLDLGYTPVVFECVAVIFAGESSWRPDVVAPDTGGVSYGLGQRHGPTWGAPPQPWPVADQVAWFSSYAEDRYGGWCPAASKWLERAAARNGRGWW